MDPGIAKAAERKAAALRAQRAHAFPVDLTAADDAPVLLQDTRAERRRCRSRPEAGRSKQDFVSATTESAERTFNGEINAEVHEPVWTESNSVPLSVMCGKGDPTNGASPSLSANALVSNGASGPRP
ncbi:hypothetical protein AB0P17_26705 [Streptomyces sp. NPDC088124]|uniref:hypothetical protein n=1 Tax=Streptomyces sp. NPDC088124 TaxID=3154654 RepID=UPI00344808D5